MARTAFRAPAAGLNKIVNPNEAASARVRIDGRRIAALATVAAACVQFAIMASISSAQTARRSLTWDFAVYYQAFFAIARGRFDAFESLTNLPFVHIHANVLMWPLALAASLFPVPLTLKLISDLAAALATYVGLRWAREIVRDRVAAPGAAAAILTTCIVVAVFNPWTYQSNAFDFHFYAICALAAVGLGRALYHGNALAACCWMLVGISAGDVSTTIVAATAFGLALAVPKARLLGLALSATACAVFAGLMLAHFVVGDEFGTNFANVTASHGHVSVFDVIAGLITHPAVVFGKFVTHADALYANVSPSGFIGLLCPLTAIPTLLVLFENVMTTNVHDFIWPGNETAPVYYLLVPGLAWSLARLQLRLGRRALVGASVLAALNCMGWFATWFPLVEPQWIRVAPATSQALDALHARLADGDEMIASDYFIGTFVDRENAYAFRGGKAIPIRARTYIALSTRQGTGRNGWVQTYGGIAALLHRPDARLVTTANDLWIFEIPRASSEPFRAPAHGSSFPGAVFSHDVGFRDARADAMVADGTAGYLIRDATWREPPGSYVARIAATGPIAIEAWDISRGQVLARSSTDAHGLAVMPFAMPYEHSDTFFTGSGIFRCGRQIPPDDDAIEVRVAVASGARARVTSVTLGGDRGLEPME